MRNIPMFVTDNGAASLTLEQIPYSGVAYVQLLDASEPEAMLHECRDFCRAAGAESVYACGHPIVAGYPFYASVLLYSGNRNHLPATQYTAQPVTEEDLEQWRQIYNERMTDVACAAHMTMGMAQRYCREGTGYMVRDTAGKLCGIGTVVQDQIGAVISLYPGMGDAVLCALCKKASSDQITLEVSSTNERAIRLYLRLGFSCIRTLSSYYKIF